MLLCLHHPMFLEVPATNEIAEPSVVSFYLLAKEKDFDSLAMLLLLRSIFQNNMYEVRRLTLHF
jgi:hypothetical protein